MKINIIFFKVRKDISEKNKKLIKKIVFRHAKTAMKKLGIDLINVVIYPNHRLVVPKIGAGGFAPSNEWIRLSLDPLRKDKYIEDIIKNVMPLIIYHEMNHVARWTKPGYGNNLMEVIISEGLATIFAGENWNLFQAPWGKYKQNEIREYMEILNNRDKNQDKNYSHSEWFFGKDKPKWMGYKLGAYIVRNVRKRHPKINEKRLVGMNAKKIIKLSGLNL
jgi:hypothetical protein